MNNPLSGFAASPFSRACAREGGRRQRGGAALARRLLASAAPVFGGVDVAKWYGEELNGELRKWNNDKPMIDHVEYRRTHHNEYRYCQDIKDWHDKDNFDFTEGDFS